MYPQKSHLADHIKVFILSLAIGLFLASILIFYFSCFEPAGVGAATDSNSILLSVISEININCSSTAALSPAILSESGGVAKATFGCIVETNDTSGYTLSVKEDGKLRMGNGGTDYEFDNYPSSTPYTYEWTSPSSGNEFFGFCANSGTDVAQAYKDNGSGVCGTGTNVSPWKCWNGFSTTDEVVAQRSSQTLSGGHRVEFGLKAEAATSNDLAEGVYSNTIIATALAQ